MMLALADRADICKREQWIGEDGQLVVQRVLEILPRYSSPLRRYRAAVPQQSEPPVRAFDVTCRNERHTGTELWWRQLSGIRRGLASISSMGHSVAASGLLIEQDVRYRPSLNHRPWLFYPDINWGWNSRGPFVTNGELKAGTPRFHDYCEAVDAMYFADMGARIIFPGEVGAANFQVQTFQDFGQRLLNLAVPTRPTEIPDAVLSDAIESIWEGGSTAYWTGCTSHGSLSPCALNRTVYGCGSRNFVTGVDLADEEEEEEALPPRMRLYFRPTYGYDQYGVALPGPL